MKIYSVKQIAEIDKHTITNEPISSIDLMERASKAIYNWIIKKVNFSDYLIAIGPGNNGGDGLALARLLAENGKKVNVILFHENNVSNDCASNLKRLEKINSVKITNYNNELKIDNNVCVIDALYGSGLSRPLEGKVVNLINDINNHNNFVISVDMPSGLMGEDNRNNCHKSIIKASVTLSLEYPKLCFFFPENSNYVGDWHVISIKLIDNPNILSEYTYLNDDFIKSIIKKRGKFSHKGDYGHALICAGSRGKYGAAILAAKSCLKSGAGLVTVNIPIEALSAVHSSVPEAMCIFDNNTELSEAPNTDNFSAIAIGPGIGTNKKTVNYFKNILNRINCPLVIDADALNIISEHKELLDLLPKNTIITPHIGEFSRLIGAKEDLFTLHKKAIDFAKQYNITVILKNAYTFIISPNGEVFVNSTGNPGMATAGSGDVLTGIIASFLAQGYSQLNASVLAVFLHGMAGDIAAKKLSEQSLTAAKIISYLCKSFKKIK